MAATSNHFVLGPTDQIVNLKPQIVASLPAQGQQAHIVFLNGSLYLDTGVQWVPLTTSLVVAAQKLNEHAPADGDIDAGGQKIVALADGILDTDAVTVAQMNAALTTLTGVDAQLLADLAALMQEAQDNENGIITLNNAVNALDGRVTTLETSQAAQDLEIAGKAAKPFVLAVTPTDNSTTTVQHDLDSEHPVFSATNANGQVLIDPIAPRDANSFTVSWGASASLLGEVTISVVG